MYDTELRTHAAVHEVAVECVWKLAALLRTRRYHDVPKLQRGLSRTSNGAPQQRITPHVLLAPVNRIQRRFLGETCVCDEQAFSLSNLDQLSVRRDVAMSGVIHNAILGKRLSQFYDLFNFGAFGGQLAKTRSQCSRHRFQLEDPGKEHELPRARLRLNHKN